jgi:hypothetical protein
VIRLRFESRQELKGSRSEGVLRNRTPAQKDDLRATLRAARRTVQSAQP